MSKVVLEVGRPGGLMCNKYGFTVSIIYMYIRGCKCIHVMYVSFTSPCKLIVEIVTLR